VTERRQTPQAIGRRGRPIRVPRLALRATDAEWQAILHGARASSKRAAPFVRESVLQAVGGAGPHSATTLLLRELGRAGTALAHLAATARETGTLPTAATLETALADLVAATRGLTAPNRKRPTEP
jgi:hypothetical protein